METPFSPYTRYLSEVLGVSKIILNDKKTEAVVAVACPILFVFEADGVEETRTAVQLLSRMAVAMGLRAGEYENFQIKDKNSKSDWEKEVSKIKPIVTVVFGEAAFMTITSA